MSTTTQPQPARTPADNAIAMAKEDTQPTALVVAGGVAAKMGFFKVIWVALLAAKKFVLLAIVAIGGWLSKLFGKKKSSASQDAA